ncbi:19967_t:CDS:2, partial [Gigaspora margarita]
ANQVANTETPGSLTMTINCNNKSLDLNIVQSNKTNLEHLARSQVKLKYLINEQQSQLEKVFQRLNNIRETYKSVEAIRQLLSELFHEHKQISDEKIKMQLKNKLENDKDCSEQLQSLKERRFSSNKL